jgi:hypothetical protein
MALFKFEAHDVLLCILRKEVCFDSQHKQTFNRSKAFRVIQVVYFEEGLNLQQDTGAYFLKLFSSSQGITLRVQSSQSESRGAQKRMGITRNNIG